MDEKTPLLCFMYMRLLYTSYVGLAQTNNMKSSSFLFYEDEGKVNTLYIKVEIQ